MFITLLFSEGFSKHSENPFTSLKKESRLGMKKTFEYNGQTFDVDAAPSKQGGMFVTVKSFHDGPFSKGTQMIWNKDRGWIKNGGMPYAKIVADLLNLK